MPALNHSHSWRRVKHPKRKDLFVCLHPECTKKENAAYLVDKIAQCPYCEKDYKVTVKILSKLKVLHCEDCKLVRGRPKGKIESSSLAKPEELQMQTKLEEMLKESGI